VIRDGHLFLFSGLVVVVSLARHAELAEASH